MPRGLTFVMFHLITCWLIPSPIDGAACYYTSGYFICLLLLLYLFTCSDNATYRPDFKILFFHCFGFDDFTSGTVFWRAPGWRSSLGRCATSRKAAGSIPDGVIGIFHWHNPSGRTVPPGLTQPLTEMSTRNISWGFKGGRWVGLTMLISSCADCLEIWGP